MQSDELRITITNGPACQAILHSSFCIRYIMGE